MFSRFDIIPACDRQTDGQTSCHLATAQLALIKLWSQVRHDYYTRTYDEATISLRHATTLRGIKKIKGPFIATQLNSTQLDVELR